MAKTPALPAWNPASLFGVRSPENIQLCYAHRFAGGIVRLISLLLAIGLLSPFCFAQQSATQAPPQTQMYVEPTMAYTPSLDLPSMDRSADPCADFYQYSCGGWQKNNPIPPDQTSWSVYGKLYEDNLKYLRAILEQASVAKDRDAVTQKIGDYYAACMDEPAIEKLGAKPMQSKLEEIAALKSINDLAPLAAHLHIDGEALLFGAGSQQDPDNSDVMIVSLIQGGLGLPDRDYYTKDDPKSKEIRERYLQYVQKMFEMLGDAPDVAKTEAATVMRLGDRPGQGVPHPRRSARSLQSHAQDEGRRPGKAGARLQLDGIFFGQPGPALPGAQP